MDDKTLTVIVTSLSGTRYSWEVRLREFETVRTRVDKVLRNETILMVRDPDDKYVALRVGAIERFEDAEV